MFAVIKKQGNLFELQFKPEIDSRVVSFSEKCFSDEILKQSLSLNWKPYDKHDVVWYAEY